MRSTSLVVAIVLALILVAAAVALRGDSGSAFTRWLASMHGGSGHR